MAVDLSVFDKLKTMPDYMRAEEEFNERKKARLLDGQYKQAQIGLAQQKANAFDLDGFAERVLVKAAQGQELSPEEQAIGRAYDAKRSQVYTDEMGNIVRKPPAFGSLTTGQPGPTVASRAGTPAPTNPSLINGVNDMMAGMKPPGSPLPAPPRPGQMSATGDDLEASYQRELAAATGNPKLQQTIREAYTKKRLERQFAADGGFNEGQSNAAGFADRMALSNPLIEENMAAGTNPIYRAIDKVPFGNFALPKGYQLFEQGQRDFVNAVLRKESGAVIAESEFQSAARQYFPVPGDTPEVIKQKADLRAAALQAMQRSAGPAYKPPAPKFSPSKVPKAAIEELWRDKSAAAEFDETFGAGASQYYLGKGPRQ